MAWVGVVEAPAILKQGGGLKSQKVKNKKEEVFQRWVLEDLCIPDRQKNNAPHTSCLVGKYQKIIQIKPQVLHRWSANYYAFQWQLFKAHRKHDN